jgi:hypothetical protein
MMRSFSCQLGSDAEKCLRSEPVYTTGFGFLGTAKPTLPELTPETKGIAEVNRHSAAREHRNGDRGAWMGRGERCAKICPLPGASPGVQDQPPGTRREVAQGLREPLHAHQQSSEQHKHLALIRPTAIEGLLNLGYSVSGFSGRRPNLRGVLPLSASAFSLQNRAEGGIEHLVWRGGGGLNSRSAGIHFHLNQPLTANCQ